LPVGLTACDFGSFDTLVVVFTVFLAVELVDVAISALFTATVIRRISVVLETVGDCVPLFALTLSDSSGNVLDEVTVPASLAAQYLRIQLSALDAVALVTGPCSE
jgi:hypothetical protein